MELKRSSLHIFSSVVTLPGCSRGAFGPPVRNRKELQTIGFGLPHKMGKISRKLGKSIKNGFFWGAFSYLWVNFVLFSGGWRNRCFSNLFPWFRLTDWLTDWLPDWLTDWLAAVGAFIIGSRGRLDPTIRRQDWQTGDRTDDKGEGKRAQGGMEGNSPKRGILRKLQAYKQFARQYCYKHPSELPWRHSPQA